MADEAKKTVTVKKNRWDARNLPAGPGGFYYGGRRVEQVGLVEATPCARRVVISDYGIGNNQVVIGSDPRSLMNGNWFPLQDLMVIYLEPGEELYAQNYGGQATQVYFRVEEVFENADCR